MRDKMHEKILCFPTSVLDELGPFQGLSTDVDRFFPAVVTPPRCTYVPRGEAEGNDRIKQVIPYVLFVCKESLFSYRRGRRGSEERLHELYSVGIGGHIEVQDQLLFSADAVGYHDAMWREIHEEVLLDGSYTETCVGLINDDSTPVGRVHFGMVHLIELERPGVAKNESKITDAGWITFDQARSRIERYEGWSQICLENMDLLMRRRESTNASLGTTKPSAAL
jgi:predicted NUDIX family phosphoesterase